MWLVGFSNEAALRDVITPSVKEGWEDTPSAAPAGAGFATYNNDARIEMDDKMAALGLANNDCGAFFAGTDMTQQASSYVSTYKVANEMMQLKQDGSSPYPTYFRAGVNTYLSSTDHRQDGVFVASRKLNKVVMTRIYGGRVAQNTSSTQVTLGAVSDNSIYLWGDAANPTTKGNVSTVGITFGLAYDEAETLGGLLYDLCVGIGHTDLEDTIE